MIHTKIYFMFIANFYCVIHSSTITILNCEEFVKSIRPLINNIMSCSYNLFSFDCVFIYLNICKCVLKLFVKSYEIKADKGIM